MPINDSNCYTRNHRDRVADRNDCIGGVKTREPQADFSTGSFQAKPAVQPDSVSSGASCLWIVRERCIMCHLETAWNPLTISRIPIPPPFPKRRMKAFLLVVSDWARGFSWFWPV